MKRRMFTLLLALVLCLGLLPMGAMAAEDTPSDTVKHLAGLIAVDEWSRPLEITPAFSPDTKDYTIMVTDSDTKVYFRPTLPEGADAAQYKWRIYSKEYNRDFLYDFNGQYKGLTFGPYTKNNVKYPAAPKFDLRLEKADGTVLDTYHIQMKALIKLRNMSVTGVLWEKGFNRNDTECIATVVNDPNAEITVTPTLAKPDKGHNMTVNGKAATSGKPVTLRVGDLTFKAEGEEQICRIPVRITPAEGADEICPTLENTYTLVLKKGPSGATPGFMTQPEADTVRQYFVGASVLTLNVLASASGKVSYQWYSNTTKSTIGGTPIQGATGKNCSPSTEKAGKTYYYCVATNAGATENNVAASNLVEVNVYEMPNVVIKWDMTIPDLPTDKGDLFGENTKGFYYEYKQTEGLVPLKVIYATGTLPPGAKAYCTWRYESENGSNGGLGSGLTCTPKVDRLYGGCTYTALPYISLGGRYYYLDDSAISTYVHVGEAPDLTDYVGMATGYGWTGSGTEADPWILADKTDLEEMRTEVNNNGISFLGHYFKLGADMDLGTWSPIGSLKPGQKWAYNGRNLNPFSGDLDCDNHTLTFAEGSTPLFGYVREATVKNLKINAPYMAGYALVENHCVDYGYDGDYNAGKGGSYVPGCPDTIDIDNVTLLSGSVIQKGGFIGDGGSGGNVVNITSCRVEEGVKIGYTKTADGVAPSGQNIAGSFAGNISGTITNCVSWADVSAVCYAGGIVGAKSQSMGPYAIHNCAFFGTVEATGNYPSTTNNPEKLTEYAGAIVGAGYFSSSAPNTLCAIVENCYADATVTSSDYAGGIFGGEPGSKQCWPNGIGYIRNNVFAGTVTGAKATGGVIGYMNSLNRYNIIANNYYLSTVATKGIGEVNTENVDTTSDTYGRTDDPLGKDADKLTKAKTAAELKDGSVVTLLNNGEGSYKNWVQGTDYPVHSEEPVVYNLVASGEYQNEYHIGEELNLEGMVLTALRTDGKRDKLNWKSEGVKIDGFDNSKRAVQTLTVSYAGAKTEIKVTVLKKSFSNNIKVKFTLLGDDKHGDPTEETGTHTLAANNLTAWIPETEYEVDMNATVWDLIQTVVKSENEKADKTVYSITNPSKNYIEAITKDGVKLGEFTNGDLSGWMYTLNGGHPNLGVSEQYLEDGDEIIFHYTDDYTQEKDAAYWTVEMLIADIGDVTPESKGAIEKARAAYDALTDEDKKEVSNYDVLTAAEAKLAELTSAAAVKAVSDQIDAIGEVTADSKEAIEAARAAYDALTDKEKKEVSNYDVLTAAETKLAELTAAAADAAAAKTVSDQIAAIGEVTADSKEAIEAARKAYDALTDAQKALVQNYDVLTAAEAKLAELTKPADMPFTDLASADGKAHWATDAIEYVYQAGLMSGTSETTFAPDVPLTRGMLVTMLYRLEKEPAVTGTSPFTDVAADTWYTNAVTWANAEGIVEGVSETSFAPDQKITREQMAAMLYRYANAKGYDTTARAELNAYTDAASVSDYAVDALRWSVKTGLITGMTETTLVPRGDATRAQTAMVLMRFMENVAK